jgi:predicted AlkP superfamily pyrophosphatase or phosphodiesterase
MSKKSTPRSAAALFVMASMFPAAIVSPIPGFASAYNGHPRLIVVIVIDQFRGDYLERYRDEFGDAGFRFLLDHGAYFPDCNYNYANTRTAPGHSTLFTGAYTNGHGIVSNEWWDTKKKRMVTSVEDDDTKLVGAPDGQTESQTQAQAIVKVEKKSGSSPHNLLADTLGDEMKLATQGKSRVFAISLKDRASVLPGGFSADSAYWIDPQSGAWITSTYYRSDLPPWAQNFNASRTPKYWGRDWLDAQGAELRSTAHRKNKDGSDAGFYEVIGPTRYGNLYELEFAKDLIVYENVGRGPATDLLSISLSANDILGHGVGPDSPEMHQMALDLDNDLADFFNFLGHQIGLADVWIAISADHGVSALPDVAKKLRIPAENLDTAKIEKQINDAMTAKFSSGHAATHPAKYVKLDYPLVWLDPDAFGAAHVRERDAETAVGEALKQAGLRDYYTKSQLAAGEAPNTALGRKYLNSYSPEGSWYVMGVPDIYTVGPGKGTDHTSPYNYDTHVPLLLYGIPFQPGTYRAGVEPVDLAPTLASLLGINAPTHSIGRVLTEAIAATYSSTADKHSQASSEKSPESSSQKAKP